MNNETFPCHSRENGKPEKKLNATSQAKVFVKMEHRGVLSLRATTGERGNPKTRFLRFARNDIQRGCIGMTCREVASE